jgi:hypothetical protein
MHSANESEQNLRKSQSIPGPEEHKKSMEEFDKGIFQVPKIVPKQGQ